MNIINNFIKYGIVGGFSFLVDILLLYFLVEFLNIYYLISVTLSLIVATLLNYYLNKKWSFNNTKAIASSFNKYIILFIFNYIMTISMMYFFVSILDFNYLVIKSVIVILLIFWNFIVYKFYVYK